MSATAAAGLAQLKQGMKAMWMAGDFGQIAKHSEKGADELVSRLNIQPGNKVLDVACGTGNLAIPAARRGAKVTGIDIASNLLAQARQRAAAEGLDVKGDVRTATGKSRGGTDSRMPAGWNDCDGELDTRGFGRRVVCHRGPLCRAAGRNSFAAAVGR